MTDTRVSIHVNAAPEHCWRLVSDITNMGRWSPETYHTRWVDGGPQPGNRFKGWNRRGPLRWSTVCVIDEADCPRRFTFTVEHWNRRMTTWSYHFQGESGGTRMTETRTSLATFRPFQLVTTVIQRGRPFDYRAAMAKTLQRIRVAAEAVPGAS